MVWRRRGGRASFCRAAKEADGKRRSPRLEGDSRRDCPAEPRGAANGGRPFEGERGLCLRCGPVARHPEEALERAGAAAMRALRVPAAREGVHNPVPRDRAGRCEGVNQAFSRPCPATAPGDTLERIATADTPACAGVSPRRARAAPGKARARRRGAERHPCQRGRWGRASASAAITQEGRRRAERSIFEYFAGRFLPARATAREKVNF